MAVGLINSSWEANDTTAWRFEKTSFSEKWVLTERFSHGFTGEEPAKTYRLKPSQATEIDWGDGLEVKDKPVRGDQIVLHTAEFTVDKSGYQTEQTYLFDWRVPDWMSGPIAWFMDWELEHNMSKSQDTAYSITVDYGAALAVGAKYFAGRYAARSVLRDRFVVEMFGNLLPRPGVLRITIKLTGIYATGVAKTIDTHHWINLSASVVRPRIGVGSYMLYTYASEAEQPDEGTSASDGNGPESRPLSILSTGWEQEFD